ncbi:rod-binding protein [Abyssisolibacter fermentans]|uniref:rod-binding protein n=1 Tax=Abyssisolibacter fermentans TaxID=1766203 RepID=UPI000830F925|nr:rod-binding protein [Abyssisolibacter fermentans]
MDNLNINNNYVAKTVYNSKASSKNKEEQALMKACQNFESLFLNIMLKEMNKTVGDGGLVQKSSARKMFEEMYTEKLADDLTNKGQGIGLAKVLFENMKNRI